jgi:hypothetical protein
VEKWGGEIWAAIIAAGVPALAGIAACFRWLLSDRNATAYERGWDRVGELEEEVRLLRIALHRATHRGNTGWTVSEILSLAMPLPFADRIRAVKQAREIVERSMADYSP